MMTLSTKGQRLFVASLGLAFSLNILAQQPPEIRTQPSGVEAASGQNVTLSVEAAGEGPLSYRWRLNGTELAGATEATLVMTNVNFTRGGAYNVVVSSPGGSVASDYAVVTVDPELCFQVVDLLTNGIMTTEVYPAVSYDQGAIAPGEDTVFINGANALGIYDGTWLSPMGTAPSHFYSLVGDLRAGTVYSFGYGTSAIGSGGSANSLLEVDGQTGALTGKRINLSTTINLNYDSGIFSGYGRIVVWNGSRFYHIDLPSGLVTDLGARNSFTHRRVYGWAFWGVAEYYGGALRVVYVQDTQTIVRMRVGGNAAPAVLETFSDLGYMAAITLSTFNSRWYFHHEYTSQFNSSYDHVLGSAKAFFVTEPSYPNLYINPVPRTNYPGDTVVFEALAGGAQPMGYQWQFKGVKIPGATSRFLVLTNVQPEATGNYAVMAANGAGAVTSPETRLFVVSAPAILVQPLSQSALPGTNVTFSVTLQAAPPVTYQWRFNGAPLPGATNRTLVLSDVTADQAGYYSVVAANRYGSTNSVEALLAMVVDTGFSFRVKSLGSAATAIDHSGITGATRSSFAVSSNYLLYVGGNGVGRFSAADLSGGANLGSYFLDSLVTDLRSEKVYSLATGTNLIGAVTGSGVTVSNLIEIDCLVGRASTNRIKLSSPLVVNSGSGLFSGYGQVVVYNGSRVYSIAVPSGVVADLGAISYFQHQAAAGWAFSGLAENFGGATYIVYARDPASIVRTRVPDGQTASVANFVNLGALSTLSASVSRGRWYFHISGASDFASGSENLGFCPAEFSVTANQTVDHFVFAPVLSSPSAETPFEVTVTALTVLNDPVTNFAGPVSLTAALAGGGQSVPASPAVLSDFVNGVWSGLVAVGQADVRVALRVQDSRGHIGLSNPFDVGAANDLKVSLESQPALASIHGQAALIATLTNTGPASSTGVWLTNWIPQGATLLSASSSQGGLALSNAAMVVFDLGAIPGGTAAWATLLVGTDSLGFFTNRVEAVRNEPDLYPANNSASLVLQATPPQVSINDISLVKPRSGSSNALFTVSLSVTSDAPVRVMWTTTNGTATSANGDFPARYGTLTLNPGVRTATCTVPVTGNTLYQPGKYFSVLLTNITGGVPFKTQGVCTILDTNLPPGISVADTSIPEGNTGNNQLQFQVQLNKKPGVNVTVRYTTLDGAARAGADYQTRAGVLTFASGITNQIVNVPVIPNTTPETDKTVILQLSDPQNAVLVRAEASGVIQNDDGIGVVDHFLWSNLSPTQVLNQPFSPTVTACDFLGAVITNFKSTVTLSCAGGGGADSAVIGASNATWDMPLDTYWHDCRTTVIYPASELKGAHRITALALNVATLPGQGMTNFIIRMKHSTLTAWPSSPTWDNAGWTVVYRGTENLSARGWNNWTFAIPFDYNGADSLLIDFSINNSSWTSAGLVAATSTSATRSMYFYCDSCSPGDPLSYNNSQNSPNTSSLVPQLKLTYNSANLPLSPVVSTAFTNGVWAGPVRVQAAGEDFRLGAYDSSQHGGYSDPFQVLPADDLAVYLQPSGNPAPVGQDLVYSIMVSNAGPSSSTGVVLTNWAPDNALWVGATLDHGEFTFQAGRLAASIGTLAAGETARLAVIVRPTNSATLTNIVLAARAEDELYKGNNAVTNRLDAAPLGVSVADVSLAEGASGSTNAVFHVLLSASPSQTVTVEFATRDGSALAGQDYAPDDGILIFPPGVTNIAVPIRVFGDLLNEASETFYLDLTNAVNAPLSRASASATIVNDDPMPMISVDDVAVVEGDSGLTPVPFVLRLSAASGFDIPVHVSTAGGSALAGRDFVSTNTVVLFPAGATRVEFTLFARGNRIAENDKTFYLNLDSPAHATLATVQARAFLINDDGAPAGFDHFVWAPLASSQIYDRPFAASLSAVDSQDAVATNYNGVVSLAGLCPAGTVSELAYGEYQVAAAEAYSITLGFAFTPSSDITVTHLRAANGTKISLWNAAGTLLGSVSRSAPLDQWTEIALASPVPLSAGSQYIVAYFTGGATNPYAMGTALRTEFDHGAIDTGIYTEGDSLPATLISFTAWGVDFRYTGPAPNQVVPVSPDLVSFTNGHWAGYITIQTPVTNLFLVADDSQGHTGATPAFDLLFADLSAASPALSSDTPIYTPYTWDITVTNQGPSSASAVVIDARAASAGLSLVSFAATQGECLRSNGSVLCLAGDIPPGATATLSLTLRPARGGSYTNEASVSSAIGDPNPSNNTVVFVILAQNDDDRDGLPDDWELSHDFDPGNPADALLDLDGDGVNTLGEYRAGADPRDPNSTPRLQVRTENDYIMLVFESVVERSYQVESSSRPAGGPWIPVGDLIRGDGDTKAVLGYPSQEGAARFYRLRISF